MKKIGANLLISIVVCMFLCTLTSCKKDVSYENPSSSIITPKVINDGDIVLGPQMSDPYNVSNMQAAFDSLVIKGVQFPFGQVPPTGKYVRILAESEYERALITQDSTILWLDFPLNYELGEGGISFHDPSLPDSSTFLYGVVPVSYTPPSGLTYELIYEVFIPDDYQLYEKYKNSLDLLEDKSTELCGYDDEYAEPTKSGKWSPSATITAYEDLALCNIPLEGVKVVAKRWSKSRWAYTDANGSCTIGEFKSGQKVNYIIKWEGSHWDIRDGYWGQAYYNGPKLNGAWTYAIGATDKSNAIAAIHRAVYYSCYGDIMNIQRPFLLLGKTKISYIHGTNESMAGATSSVGNFAGIIPNIRIWGYTGNSMCTTNDLISTTFHEMAHVSHRRFIGNNAFWNTSDFIIESWARAVQVALSNKYYNEKLSSYPGCLTYTNSRTVQDWTQNVSENSRSYTPVFIDLMDDYNQSILSSNYINDEIQGYTLQEIQNYILQGSYGLSSLSVKLKANKMHGATDEQIDNLLSKYQGVSF